MALRFFWRCEGTSLSNNLDYTKGSDYGVFMANSSSISASAARVGSAGILRLASTSGGAQIDSDNGVFPGDINSPSGSVGSVAYSSYSTGSIVNLFGDNYGFRWRGVNANDEIKSCIGPTGTGGQRLGIGVRNSVNGRYDVFLNTNLPIGVWFGVVLRWDFPNLKLRIELYDANGDLVEAADNGGTDFSANIPSDLAQLFSWGMANSSFTSNIYFDNCFIADTYDEPLQKFFTINDYNEYINNIGFTSSGLSLSKKYVTRRHVEDAVGSLIGNSNMLFGCGLGSTGKLGTGVNTSRSSPVSVLGGVGWIDVAAAGEGAAFGLKSDGTLWAWGNGNLGHLGDGTTVNRSSPVTVVGALSWRALAAGKYAAYGITTDGQLWSWGGGLDGAKGDGTTTDTSSPGTVAGGGTTWKQVSSTATGQVAGAIKTDGTLWMWGLNSNGQLGDGTTVNKSSPITVAGGGNTWKQVSAGASCAGAVKTDGSLWTWGQGTDGMTGKGNSTSVSSPTTTAGGGYDWKFVAFNYRNNGAIKVDGSLWMWGKNESGGVGDGTTVNKNSPVTVAGGGYNWRWLSVGSYILNGDVASAVKSDGTLWTWGYNANGQLADGTTVNKSSPVSVITTDWIRWSRSSNADSYMFAMTETDAITLFKR